MAKAKKIDYEAFKASRIKVRMTAEQQAWCKLYKEQTTFEPLMDDFLYGNCTFVEAARRSNHWFESWSSDAYLNITRRIPGDGDEEPSATVRGTTK